MPLIQNTAVLGYGNLGDFHRKGDCLPYVTVHIL